MRDPDISGAASDRTGQCPRGIARRLGSLLSLALLLVSSALAADELDKVRLQLQWKHQFEYAGFYAAKEKGYYAEAGLDVEFLEFTQNTHLVDDLLAGKADFAVGYASIIADYLNGKPIVLIANFLKRSPIAIVAQPDIKTPRDLVGKRVMTSGDSGITASTAVMLSKFGVGQNQIDWQPPSFGIQDFIAGKVDAMFVFTSNEPFLLEEAGKDFNLFDPSVYGAEHYDLNLFTTQAQVKEHPHRVQLFRDASIKGWQYAVKHPSEIVILIEQQYNTQDKSHASLHFEAERIIDAMMPGLYPVGSVDGNRVQMIAADFVQEGLAPADRPLDFRGFLYKPPPPELHLTPSESRYLGRKHTITYCADPDWLPYESIDNGRHRGMAADYFALFADKLGVDFHLVPTHSWTESIAFAKNRQCDLFSLAMSTPERRVYMAFTDPYLRFPLVIATRTETLFVNDLDEVKTKPIGVVRGYAYTELLKAQYPGINLVEVANLHEGLEQVAAGKLFGCVDSLASIGAILQRDFVGELKIAGKFADEWELSVGVRNDDPVLLEIMNKAVNSIAPDEHDAIADKWITVLLEVRADYGLAVKIGLGLSLIILLFIYHNSMQARLLKRLNTANSQLREKTAELAKLSTIDKLTGLLNRAKIDELLEQEFARTARYHAPFSIALLDIDHFKAVNDEFGHQAGDRVLKTFANLLISNLRVTDSAGRWGGEEFLVLFPQTPATEVEKLAEKLRQKIAEHDFGLQRPVTASIGLCQTSDGISLKQLISAADNALYQAKHAGRNQVRVAASA